VSNGAGSISAPTHAPADDLMKRAHGGLAGWFVCCASALSGMGLVILVYYPGYMTGDSFIQLIQALNGVLGDWQPPMVSLTWWALKRLIPGPLGMLLLVNGLFWLGLGLTAYVLGARRIYAAAAILIVGLFPPVFAQIATLQKDTLMAAGLLLSFGMLSYVHTRSSKVAWLIGTASLVYPFAVRYNAAAAVLPLALWSGALFSRLFLPRHPKRLAIGALAGMVLFGALGAAVHFANTLMVEPEYRRFPFQQILLHDLTAMSVRSHRVLVPSVFADDDQPITVQGLACLYNPGDAYALYSGRYNQCAFHLRQSTDRRELSALTSAWTSTVPAHVGAYVEHRLTVFRREFALDGQPVCRPFQVGIAPNSLGIEFQGSALNTAVTEMMTATAASTSLFHGWIYLGVLAGLALLALLGRVRDPVPALVLGTSGLLYAAAYLVVSTTCDFRMHWWCVVAAVLLVPLTLASLADRWSGTDGATALGHSQSSRAA
jgi:hypothetical protein